jgi:hypothetical protein
MKKNTAFVPEAKTFDEEQLEVIESVPIALPRHRSTIKQTGGGGRPERRER